MTERIDHAAEAEAMLAHYAIGHTVAHVHATLALVEQQRIANLIAYLTVAEGVRGGAVASDAGIQALDVDIREGLRL